MSAWRQYRSTVVLLLLAVGLGLVVFWDRGRVTTSEAKDRQFQLFDAWRPNDVTALRVAGAGYRIALKRKRAKTGERHWHLRQDDRDVGTDEQQVEQLLLSLEYASFARLVALPEDRLGLKTPLLDLTLQMGDLRYRLRIGKAAPAPVGARYARVEGGARKPRNYVVGRKLVDSLTKQLRNLRDRRIVPYYSVELQRVELSEHFVLERGGWGGRTTGAFALVGKEPKRRVNRRVFDAWLANLASLEAQRFLSPKTPPAKDALRLVFSSRDKSKAPVTLWVGGACPEASGVLVVRQGSDPLACCVAKRVAEKLRLERSDLVDPYVIGSAATDVSSWVVKSGTQIMDLARKGTGWVMRKPSGGEVDSAAVTARLEAMVRSKGRLLDAAELSEDLIAEPSAELTIVSLPERGTADSKERVETFRVGKPVNGQVYFRRGDDGAVLALPEAAAALFNPSPSLLRGPTVWRRALANVLAIENSCGPRLQRAERSLQGNWDLKVPNPSPLVADMGDWNGLANFIAKLDAQRWVAERPLPQHGLTAGCQLSMRMRIPESKGGGETTLRLRIGAEAQGGYYASASGSDAVFVIARPIVYAARRWLLDRAALMVAPERVRKITLRDARGRSLELGRGGSGWVLGGKSSALARRLGKALEKFVAEGIVDVGARSTNAAALATIEIENLGEQKPRVLRIEAAGVWKGDKVYWVRDEAIAATFALLRPRVDPLLNAL